MSQFSRDFWQKLDAAKLNGEFGCTQKKSEASTQIDSSAVLRKIEDVIVGIVNDVRRDISPSLQYRSRSSWSNVNYLPGLGLIMKDEATYTRVSFCKKNSSEKFGFMVKVLAMMYRLIQTNQTVTKRDLYYSDPELFKNQTLLDHLIDDIGCMLDVPRHVLNIVATSKGCVAGDLCYTIGSGELINCSQTNSGVLVPSSVNTLSNPVSKRARFLLVVEKDATFQRLIRDKLPSLLDCIMITGKGVPDVNTRIFAKLISSLLQLPVLGLFDSDPHGIEIMCVYRFGSQSLAYDSKNLALPNLHWIGLFPTDLKRLNLSSSLIPFSGRDMSKCDDLIRRPYMKSHPDILKQIRFIQELRHKAEIQSLDRISATYISDVYIPSKVKQGNWI